MHNLSKNKFIEFTTFNLITACTPISTQSSHSVVFTLQPVYFTKTYVVGTHLNCIDLLMQFKWVPTIYAFIKKIRKKKKKQKKQQHKNGISIICKSFADLLFFIYFFFKCTLSVGRYIFYHKFSEYVKSFFSGQWIHLAPRLKNFFHAQLSWAFNLSS